MYEFLKKVQEKNIPLQVKPSPENPFLHWHVKEPTLLVQLAFGEQGSLSHSLMSWWEKNSQIKINTLGIPWENKNKQSTICFSIQTKGNSTLKIFHPSKCHFEVSPSLRLFVPGIWISEETEIERTHTITSEAVSWESIFTLTFERSRNVCTISVWWTRIVQAFVDVWVKRKIFRMANYFYIRRNLKTRSNKQTTMDKSLFQIKVMHHKQEQN